MARRRVSRSSIRRSIRASPTSTPPKATANGESQTTIGKVLKARGSRKGLWLASKIGARATTTTSCALLETSLKRLQVDQVDLLHIHALMGADDLEAVSAKGGAYEAAMKAKEQKMTRFIGITCHAFPDVLKTALERHEFDCTQMALNAAMRGQVKGAASPSKTTALPVALQKEDGRHRDEDLRPGQAGRPGARPRSSSNIRCRCRWPPP